MPDIGLSTLLKAYDISNERAFKTMVLFGANGIDQENGDCGHTSGHLSVAIIANYFGIPVKIVADSFKIGRINWKPSAKRKGYWLATQKKYIEELLDNHVETMNLREDRIPRSLLWEIHTDKSSIAFRKKFDESFSDNENELQRLGKYSEELRKDFVKQRDE